MSFDNIGYNYDYPDASYERRKEIIREHETYQKGWLYFIANDPRVPADVQTTMRRWGLAKDEFLDNSHWPHQLYIREARRMKGMYVMTENELLKRRPTPGSVGMGSYSIDSHNVQRYITPEGFVQNEGDIGVSTHGPYQIAYGALVPKSGQCANLLVPVCVSSSHIAFGSIRMEPVFMILGQSAATAAVLAIEDDLAVQEVPYARLRAKLLEDGQVLEYDTGTSRNSRESADYSKLGVLVDDREAKLTGDWKQSRAAKAFVLEGYQHENNTRDGKHAARFEARLPKSGEYEVRLAWTPNANRASKVPVTVHHAGGSKSLIINQREAPPIDGRFLALGLFQFEVSQPAAVVVSNEGADG